MKYDIIIIGSGPGGYVTGIRASQLGFKVAIVEKENLGGICLNWGCIPTKALLKSAQVYDYLKHVDDYGLKAEAIDKDFEAVIKRSRGVADGMSKGVAYVDGPVLELKHTSFVGKHQVPVVYGMTIGEYGQMINGENWLKNKVKCDLKLIPLKNYTHNSEYSLPIRPSPNLPNDKSINLYPSLGFFEGTIINAGRGTEFQFQRYGAPFFPKIEFNYTPKANFGAKYPKHKGKLCYGIDLRETKKLNAINLEWLVDAYNKTPKTEKFFGSTFTIHAGNTKLKEQIEQGLSAKEIRKNWQKDLKKFKKIRKKYLIYE